MSICYNFLGAHCFKKTLLTLQSFKQLRCSFTFSGSQGQLIAKLSVFGWISVIIGSWKLNIHSKSGLCNRVLSDDLLLLPFAIILEWKFYIWTDSESNRQTKIGNWTSSRIIFAPLPIRKMNFSEFPLYSRRFLCGMTAIHLSMWKLELVLLSYSCSICIFNQRVL